jgi:hypothetical protein
MSHKEILALLRPFLLPILETSDAVPGELRNGCREDHGVDVAWG